MQCSAVRWRRGERSEGENNMERKERKRGDNNREKRERKRENKCAVLVAHYYQHVKEK